jgi:hypothetical protein
MNPIRQSLHTAARYYAKQAHLAWVEAEAAYHAMFSAAVSGHQLSRRAAMNEYLTAYGQYSSHLNKAKRARGMMKCQ